MTFPQRVERGYTTRERMNDYVGSPIMATVAWQDACPAMPSGKHRLGRLTGTCTRCNAVATITYEKGNR